MKQKKDPGARERRRGKSAGLRKQRKLRDLHALQNAVLRPLLRPLEEARMYARFLDDGDVPSQRALAHRIGVSQARISQRLALLTMPSEIVKLMDDPESGFKERHARSIRRLPDAPSQVRLARRVIRAGLTVDETARIVREMLGELERPDETAAGRPRWSLGPSLRWRRHNGWLELQVRGASHARQLKVLERFVALFRREPGRA